jgi:hypothetical protein
MRLAVVALVLAALGCRPSLPSAYTCTRNDQCVRGSTSGVCEMPAQACSFPDATCAGGRRYGDLGPPPYAGNCVDQGGPPDMARGGDLALHDGGANKIIARVGSTTVPAGDHATTVVVPALAGAVAGDVAWVLIFGNDPMAGAMSPAGWTPHADLGGGPGQNYRAGYFYRVLGAGEPSSYTFSLAATAKISAAVLVVYRNVDNTQPIDVSMTQTFVGTALDAPSITTRQPNDQLLTMFVDATPSTSVAYTAPPGMQPAGTAPPIFFFDAPQPVPGATGDKQPGGGVGIAIGAVDFVALQAAK